MAKGKAKAKSKDEKAAVVIADKKSKLIRLEIHENCEGCDKVESVDGKNFCAKYVDPSFHWENDQLCAFATHVKRAAKAAKKAVNPLKASKRAAGKR
ncbi:PxxKW family cysteine-rich protein [bacterium]|nr:PxxKW family cysteine-rich protein [bacterium]